MANIVTDRFLNDREYQIPNTIIHDLAVYLGRHYRCYCFVEGPTDRFFYSNINTADLKSNTRYLFVKNDEENFESGGKDSVLSAFNFIKNNSEYNRFMNKYVFIIDHDYAGATSEKIDINDYDVNNITITKPYSFENYFLNEENIRKLFCFLDKENYCEDFIAQYNRFANEIREYTRLKSTTIVIKQKQSTYYDEYCEQYKSIYKPNEIFVFSFTNGVYNFNRNKLYVEVSNMKQYKDRINNAREFYIKESNNLVHNNDFIRGHQAFDFLTAYLRDVLNIELKPGDNDLYTGIVKKLNVDIDIKNANGNKIIN